MDLSKLEVDLSLYEDGKKIEFGDGAYIRIRSAGSERAQKVRERLYKPYSTWVGDLPADILANIHAYWLAQGLLAEFVGFTADGKPVNVDLGLADDQKRLADVLRQPKFRAFRNKMLQVALDEANFQALADEALEKNSESLPAGDSGGAGKRKN